MALTEGEGAAAGVPLQAHLLRGPRRGHAGPRRDRAPDRTYELLRHQPDSLPCLLHFNCSELFVECEW